jgi:putative ABC transport system permease protein
MRTAAALERLWQETRYAVRRLLRSAGFTVATVLTLALAIGANASIFAVVYRVVLNPLPFERSERLVALEFSVPTRKFPTVYYIPSRLYVHYLDRARTLDGLAVYAAANQLTLTGQGSPGDRQAQPISEAQPMEEIVAGSPQCERTFNVNDSLREVCQDVEA